jgi:CRP-like cAMP-binding protein
MIENGACSTKRGIAAMAIKKQQFDIDAFLSTVDGGRTISMYQKNQTVFSQGEAANSIFYIKKGKIKVTVLFQPREGSCSGTLGRG